MDAGHQKPEDKLEWVRTAIMTALKNESLRIGMNAEFVAKPYVGLSFTILTFEVKSEGFVVICNVSLREIKQRGMELEGSTGDTNRGDYAYYALQEVADLIRIKKSQLEKPV